MKKPLLTSLAALAFVILISAFTSKPIGRCEPYAEVCRHCTDCSTCKHCTNGGKCSVCFKK